MSTPSLALDGSLYMTGTELVIGRSSAGAMIKVMVLLRRPPSWTRERFHRWWIEEHVAYGKTLPGLRKYRVCLVTGST